MHELFRWASTCIQEQCVGPEAPLHYATLAIRILVTEDRGNNTLKWNLMSAAIPDQSALGTCQTWCCAIAGSDFRVCLVFTRLDILFPPNINSHENLLHSCKYPASHIVHFTKDAVNTDFCVWVIGSLALVHCICAGAITGLHWSSLDVPSSAWRFPTRDAIRLKSDTMVAASETTSILIQSRLSRIGL